MDFNIFRNTRIFSGINEVELKEMFDWLGYTDKKYLKGETILHAGEQINSMGIIIKGSVNIENNDVWGNKSIFDNVTKGHVFGEVYACTINEVLMVDVVAAEDTEIVFLNLSRLFDNYTYNYTFQDKLLANLLKVMSGKNLNLSRKIAHTSSKGIRGRIVSYLSYMSIKHGNNKFEIPFDRQQLADYLCVDRSALSNELSKMKKEGLLNYKKNKFEIISEYEFDFY
ncbi:Crp/Fnr family transcriptional regulator [Peptostreptococcus canis]|uniref:Crp/Fnr family transcriptional regulator n=1 Tax=Peptostreptococcus canis TaxID=1159213 RepID=A0ABR6TLK9_9FIRM|nr:Crp/Fnr family transcriptional regulator [Peptostreptococcus canis]MBC2576190.1 Crp/Fnr family transcriptional regulator [Peptostreptococcus canis]MBP1998275.1 CRP-like cAMP-binding protein [Peptostreptococcus canis]